MNKPGKKGSGGSVGRWFKGSWSMLRHFGRLTPKQKRHVSFQIFLAVAVIGTAVTAAALCACNTVLPLIPSALSGSASASDSDSYAVDSYQKELQNTASGSVLAKTTDAGTGYLEDTLFVGDSNTVRLAMFGLIPMNSTAAYVGMGVESVPTSACVWFEEYGYAFTIPEAAAMLQPRRMIVMYGTNDTSLTTDTFLSCYQTALEALHEAYPYADLIIASVPPVGECYTGGDAGTVQKKIDSFNLALAKLAAKGGYKYLNSAEALKDSDGYMRADYCEADGMHLTLAGAKALLRYVRTHSYITEDTRPAVTGRPNVVFADYSSPADESAAGISSSGSQSSGSAPEKSSSLSSSASAASSSAATAVSSSSSAATASSSPASAASSSAVSSAPSSAGSSSASSSAAGASSAASSAESEDSSSTPNTPAASSQPAESLSAGAQAVSSGAANGQG